MTHITGQIKAGVEPIPGYTLCHRLGAGGFGEVWLADAPGGLKKAIKLVYGTVDEDRASSELRSLQRIRQVHHPFLLSLERIEIVNGQIIIVTELAECSLIERFQQYRRKGLPGIPRENLLDFMRDASDALDFLSQKHELQHLDVKPGNLLIVADRVKVADFGLVKDLHERNQSLIGGLTPTYAAPEIFDGHPDRRSDQYSLAIVYQELLTGEMPFAGRTTAELARQHLSQTPNLESLPPADRPIIARALSKNPLDRFSSCRQLVDQLSRVRVAAPIVSSGNNSSGTNSDTAQSNTTSQPITSTSAAFSGNQRMLSPLDAPDSCQGWSAPRCMFVGIGGVGGKSIADLFTRMQTDEDTARSHRDHAWLVIDTDSSSLDALTQSAQEISFPAGDTAQIPLFRPQEYRTASPELFRSISRRWLYNIPRSLKTEGVRPLGTLAFLDHYDNLRRSITYKLNDLVKRSQLDDSRCNEPIRVYVVSSIHGGTGSAIVTEVGYLIRDIFRQLGWLNYRLCGNLTVATTFSSAQSNLAAAAALACCSELTHCMHADAMVPPLHFSNDENCSNVQRPFDWVNLFDGGLYGNSKDVGGACESIADALWLDSQTMVGSVLSSVRIPDASKELSWLRSMQTAPVRHANNIDALSLSRLCCVESLQKAIGYMLGAQAGESPVAERPFTMSESCLGDMPLTENAIEEILQRLMLQMRIDQFDPGQEESFLHAWALRLSTHAQHNDYQFAEDLRVAQEWLQSLVRIRIYNWKQLEKLQLVFIERLMDLSSSQESDLLDYLLQFDFPGTPQEVASRVCTYLRRLASQCMETLQGFQKTGRDLGMRFKGWTESLAAEKSFGAVNELPSFESLVVPWQQVAIRVGAVLESTFQRLMLHSFNESTQLTSNAKPPANEDADIESVNLHYLLTLAHDLCERFAKDFRISQDADDANNQGMSLQQLTELLPSLSQGGGDARRMLIVPQDHLHPISQSLDKLGLTETTTLIPAALSQSAYVVLDVTNLNLAHLVGTWWRPNNSTFQIAERLRSRVDVEWPNVGRLIEHQAVAEDASVAPIKSAPITSAPISIASLDNQTLQINVDS